MPKLLHKNIKESDNMLSKEEVLEKLNLRDNEFEKELRKFIERRLFRYLPLPGEVSYWYVSIGYKDKIADKAIKGAIAEGWHGSEEWTKEDDFSKIIDYIETCIGDVPIRVEEMD